MTERALHGRGHSDIAPYTPGYDTSTFVNEGPFFDTHPGVTPHVTRYERTDMSGKLIESWERNKNGVMVNTTARDILRDKLARAQEELELLMLKEKHNDN